jgi:tRNA(fMet)-specific endonuclease VapC
MSYILDTDTLIYFLKGNESVVKRLSSVPENKLYTTIVNHSELLFGAHHSQQKNQNLKKIDAFLKHFTLLPYCEYSSHIFAEHKALLKSKGTPLDDMDLMIASISIQNQMILVSNNIKHFGRIRKLKLENWA